MNRSRISERFGRLRAGRPFRWQSRRRSERGEERSPRATCETERRLRAKRSPCFTYEGLGLALLALTMLFSASGAQAESATPAAADSLAQGFVAPPASALPRTWWHWTMSNVSKEGITKDLEWMKRVGIGGFMLADVNFGRGQTVAHPIPYGTPEWYDAVRFAAAEADRLGLEMGIFSSPGWSETGGPWVKPVEAMKKLVWSEVAVDGPRHFSGRLPEPPRNNGQIRNTGATYYPQGGGDPTYYGDSAVIAYRTPVDELDASTAKPTVTSNNGPVDGTALLDDQLNTTLTIPAPKDGGPAWVQFEFAEPFIARAITLGGKGGSANGIPVGRLLASDDGTHFRTLITLPGEQLYRQGMVRTYTFPETTAKYYRVEMSGAPLGPAATMSQAPAEPAKQYVLSEAILHRGARVRRWEEKAGFSFLFEYETVPTPPAPASATVPARDVVDLTSKLKPDGTLDWDAPPGRWTIVRFGYSLTGAKNRPATPAGSGFEADKLSRAHMESYIHGYFDPLQQALGPLFGKSLRYVMMDSWEAGTNNWTEEMLPEFRRRRGYDPLPYLPALTGEVVGSADVSDRFLWDFRRTLADMWADNHYGTMADELRKRGVGIYAEASGVSLEMPEDTLLNKSKVEIPMGEFWVRDLHPRLMYLQDVRGAASAAHVYGKNIVAAESFTGGGYESPATLKRVGDYWFAQGVNRIVFHTSAHQPLDTKPGNTMVGTHLNRNITWAEEASPVMTYFARVSYLLQQGTPVVDIAYLLNEGAPSTPPIWGVGTRPIPPAGYDYDFINADVLLHRLRVVSSDQSSAVHGQAGLGVEDGPTYRLLVLPETDRMRPELLRKVAELVHAGAVIVGRKPTASPSLAGYPAADDEVRALAADIWGDLDGVSRTIRHVGKGVVYWGWPLDKVLDMEQVAKDFDYADGLDRELAWIHRRSGDADIYYVANQTDVDRTFSVRCRVATSPHTMVEHWNPVSGEREALAAGGLAEAAQFNASANSPDQRTTIRLHLAWRESAFVVFRPARGAEIRPIGRSETTTLATLSGSWTVKFTAGLGAPAQIQVSSDASTAKLPAWTTNENDGVKYFSGTATYVKMLAVPSDWMKSGGRLWLDLGKVEDLATVTVNGRSLGLAWCAPYRVDVTEALKPGENQIEIGVTNEWTNRLIGDRVVPAAERVLNSPVVVGGFGAAPANIPLPESGLIGPVKVVREQTNLSPDFTTKDK